MGAEPSEPVIRPFRAGDADEVDACYDVCLRTAHAGEDATALHADPRIVGDVYVGPYLHGFPEFAVVVEDEHGVGGYIVGVPDTVAYDEWVDREWFPPLRARYPQGTFPTGTADADCVNLIHTPVVLPDDIRVPYPAHLHIDLLPHLQGRGLGRRLMDELFTRVREAGADAIHLGCSPENTNAIAFYRHLGFEDLLVGWLWGRSTTW